MNSYIMLFIAVVLLAGQFAMNKIYQHRAGTSVRAGVVFNSISGLCTTIVFFVINGFKVNVTWYSFLMAALMTGLTATYTVLGFRLLRSGGMAMYSLFLMTGGMVVPYLWGLLFLKEEFSIVRTVGLILIIGAVAMANGGEKRVNFKQFLLCGAIFILNGFVSVVSKLHQIEQSYTTVSSADFVLIGGIVKFVVMGIACLFIPKEQTKTERKNQGAILLIIVLAAVFSGVSYLLQLFGAKELPATVLYPIITGGSMVFSTIAGIVFFKERPSLRVIISVVICAAATFLFL